MFNIRRLFINVSPIVKETIETIRYHYSIEELAYELELLEGIVDVLVLARLNEYAQPVTGKFLREQLADMLMVHHGLDNLYEDHLRIDVLMMHKCSDVATTVANTTRLWDVVCDTVQPLPPTVNCRWVLSSPVPCIYRLDIIPSTLLI